MRDQDKTKQQLIDELGELRQRLAASEAIDARRGRSGEGCGFTRDAGDPERAGDAVRESEARFRALFQESPVGTVVVSASGNFVQVNRAFCKFVGYSETELVGKSVLSVTHPGDAQLSEQAIYQAAHSGPGIERLEKRYLHKSGRVLWGEVSSSLICDPDGTPDYFITQVLDITERKRTEEALKRAHDELEDKIERRTAELARTNEKLVVFRRFAEASGQGFAMATLSDYIAYVNPSMCHLLGEAKPENAIGKHLSAYFPKEYLEKRQKEILPSLSREGRWQGETSLLRNGMPVPVLQNSFLIRDEHGSPNVIATVVTDITERKQWEEALRRSAESLRQSERRFRNYFEQGLIGMAVTSVDKRWLEVNDRLCEILGYSREELVQTDWVALTYPDDIEPNLRLFDPLLAGEIERFTLNKRYLRKDGGIVHTTIHTRAFRKDDGTIDHIVTLIEDITARKQAEEALRQSHDELRAIYGGLRDGMLVADTETMRFMRANPAICAMLGRSEDELLSLSINDIHPPAQLRHVRDQFQQNADGSLWIAEEIPVLRRDGTIFYADIATNRLDYRGRPCVIGFFRDVTERHQAQEALERERESLWSMLQASDHERQIISYEIHDGLAQYLAAAGMQFQTHDALKEDSPDEARKAHGTAVELVRQAHFEARRLISEVRPPVIDEIGLESAISHLVHEQRRRHGPNIKFDSDVQFGRLPSILENALYRIAQESLTNACKHSKSKRVAVTLAQEGREVRLEVRDWGIGFDPNSVEKGRFGLEGIRQRVRLLGGQLSIQSAPASGTLVQVVVPLLEKHDEQGGNRHAG